MNADRLLHAFSMIGEDPARIQQLRQVAVALAIAGKLCADPSALSPRNTLRAVEQVKADLYKQRAIPKPKNLKSTEQDELPENFPDAGRFAPLGRLARVEKGLTGIKQAQPGPFPLVVTGADRATCDHFDFDGAAAIVPLVSSTGHGHASLNRLHYQEGKFALGTILAAVFPYDPALMSARFIFEYLSAFKEELLVTRMTGTANVTFSVGRIAEVPVPLIDPTTQAKVDELMALLDRLEAARTTREATRDRLTAASLARLTAPDADAADFPANARFALATLPALTTRPDQIKPLRQTILNLAVRGKLVEQDPTDEPASELLRRIATEKARLFAAGEIRRPKPSPAVTDEEQAFNHPQGWVWTRLAAVTLVTQGFAFSSGDYSKSEADGPPLIKIGDIGSNAPEVFIKGAYEPQYLVQPGDLLLGLSGSIKCSIWRGPVALLNQRIARIRPASADLTNDWLFLIVNESIEKWKAETSKLTVQNIKAQQLNEVPVPLPPLAEQHRIVATVDALMALCDRLEAALTTADTTRARLLEALLADALNSASMQEMEAAE